MFQPPFKITMLSGRGRDPPSRGYLDDTELPGWHECVGRNNGMRSRPAVVQSVQPAAHCDPRGHLTLGRLLESQGCFILGSILTSMKRQPRPLLYWTANVPAVLIKGWGCGAGGNHYSLTWPRQMRVPEGWFPLLCGQLYAETAKRHERACLLPLRKYGSNSIEFHLKNMSFLCVP